MIWYAYNTSGERTILRSTNGSATTMTVYAFGAEEYSYDGSGNLQSSTHYYDMGGRLIGELTGGGTQSTDLFLTDALGSVLTTFSNVQNSAAVQGNQVYSPYGTQLYSQGSMNTNKGYTGQYADPLTGFDYYNARYYDPVCGTFLSADPVEGNMQGLNPYAYVDGNPETYNDPTGEMYTPPPGTGGDGGSYGGNPQGNSSPPPPSCDWWCQVQQQWNNFNNYVVHPVEHLVQQAQEVIVQHVPIIVPIVIGIVVASVVASGAYAVWQFTHTNPNWSSVSASEGLTHSYWNWRDKEGNLKPHFNINKGHVLSKHVNISRDGLLNRVRQIGDNTHKVATATKFNDADIAQWTVDYALAHMTAAQKLQLLFMRGSPFGRFAQLTLTGDTGTDIGWGFRYDPNTGKV